MHSLSQKVNTQGYRTQVPIRTLHNPSAQQWTDPQGVNPAKFVRKFMLYPEETSWQPGHTKALISVVDPPKNKFSPN